MSSVETIRLRRLLLAEVLPRYLEVSGNGEVKPGENPSQFLMRLVDEATANGDWDKVQRVLDAYRLSAFAMRAPAWLQGRSPPARRLFPAKTLRRRGSFRWPFFPTRTC